MEPTVIFRDFEERDIDFIYRCKNDEKLNSMIVGQWHPFTYEEATNWVHGCMGEHETYKFWAIATNDEEKQIVGWVSISSIDKVNQSACFHGIVIGDKDYQDGVAWVESYLFVFNYVFTVLNLNRLVGSNIVSHKYSTRIAHAFFMEDDKIELNVNEKDDRPLNLLHYHIDQDKYCQHYRDGEYNFESIIERILAIN